MSKISIGVRTDRQPMCFEWYDSSVIPRTGESIELKSGCYMIIEVIHCPSYPKPTVKLVIAGDPDV